MLGKLIWSLLLASAAVWAYGVWQVAESNTVRGSAMVVVGGLAIIGLLAWRNRHAEGTFEGFFGALASFFDRAP